MNDQFVKGSAILPVIEFIKKRYGEDIWNEIIKGFNQEYQGMLKEIVINRWYPLELLSMLYTKIMERLGEGDYKICWEIGRYAADYGLNIVYKFFLKLGSIDLFVNKGPTMYSAYYKGSELKILKYKKNYIELQIHNIKTSLAHLYSIGGWVERAGELVGAKNIKIEVDTENAIFKVYFS